MKRLNKILFPLDVAVVFVGFWMIPGILHLLFLLALKVGLDAWAVFKSSSDHTLEYCVLGCLGWIGLRWKVLNRPPDQ